MNIATREEIERPATGTQLVEVLPREEFAWAHVPDALQVPLRRLDDVAAEVLDRRRPVVVYCNDFL